MRALAIDVGTNTVLGTVGERVGELAEGSLQILYDEERIVGLGRGVDRTGRLSPERIEAALAALTEHVRAARELGCTTIRAVGTSALRDAQNRQDFLAPAREILGSELEVVSGEREARLTYHGRAVGLPPMHGPVLVVDIGGGSTELVLGHDHHIASMVSLDIGSVRLFERCLSSDPPSSSELASLDAIVADALAGAPASSGRTMLALAGTASSVAMLVRGRVEHTHGARLTLSEAEAVAATLAASSAEVRRGLPGMIAARADVLVAGARILCAVARWAGVEEFIVSEGGVRHGVLVELLGV